MSFETFILLTAAISLGVLIGTHPKETGYFIYGLLRGSLVFIPSLIVPGAVIFLSGIMSDWLIKIFPLQTLLWIIGKWIIWFIAPAMFIILYSNVTEHGWKEGLKKTFKDIFQENNEK